MTHHEYTIIGHPRAVVGRNIGTAAALIAPLLASWALELTKSTVAAVTITSGLVYGGLYWIFNKVLWRYGGKLLKAPDLSGEWEVVGRTLQEDGSAKYNWNALITIVQDWDKICISLKTSRSSSYSETASIFVLPTGEVKLSYGYQNHPQPGQGELQKHQGACELTFDKGLISAEGHYFNTLGRVTVGKMTLTKAGT
jgi:hypothetical protein